MCYSAKLKSDFDKLRKHYHGKLEWDEFVEMVRQRQKGASIGVDLKIPDELIAGLIAEGGSGAKEIELMQRRWKVDERKRLEDALTVASAELAQAQEKYQSRATKTNLAAVETKGRKVERARQALETAKGPVGQYRIYPYYFAPILVAESGQRRIVPARYRILPRTGVEVPNKYNVFNARRDSLQSARNWKALFGHKHALFSFINFFEWVERDGKSVEIMFNPDGYGGMHAAALYEVYQHPELGAIRSFCMVTDEPPPEVRAAGHDRCPVFLQERIIDDWLNPKGHSLQELDALLDNKETAFYSHALAA